MLVGLKLAPYLTLPSSFWGWRGTLFGTAMWTGLDYFWKSPSHHWNLESEVLVTHGTW